MKGLICTFRQSNEHVLNPIAWALIELDEIGYAVIEASENGTPLWRIDLGGKLTSREVISFAIEAISHASSRLLVRPHEQCGDKAKTVAYRHHQWPNATYRPLALSGKSVT